MFRSYGVIIRLTFRTYYKKYTYCSVEMRSYFNTAICILLVICSESQPDDSKELKHVAV